MLTRAMARLVPAQGPAAFTFAAIDGAQSGPPPEWNLPHAGLSHLSRLHASGDGRFLAQFDPDRHFWWLFDRDTRFGALWSGNLAQLPDWEIVAPFRLLMHWALLRSDHAVVHAGAMLAGGSAVLLVGPGGSGKSTTIAAAALAGSAVLGDDLVIVGEEGPGFRVHALHDAVKLSKVSPIGEQINALGLSPETSSGKLVYRLSEIARQAMPAEAPLKALFAVEIGGSGPSRISPETPAAMLRALAPSTVFLLRGGETETFRKLSKLVRSLPCYRLRLGPDPFEAAMAVATWGADQS